MFAPGDLLSDLAPSCSCGAVFDVRLCAPQILPCSHTFCLMCLSKDAQMKKRKCGICEKKYKTFRLNLALAEAIERIRVRKDTVDAFSRRCDECDSRWPLAQMRRCRGCEADIAHLLGNPTAAVSCIVCLECAVDRHSGHDLSRVVTPAGRFVNTSSGASASMCTSPSIYSTCLGGRPMRTSPTVLSPPQPPQRFVNLSGNRQMPPFPPMFNNRSPNASNGNSNQWTVVEQSNSAYYVTIPFRTAASASPPIGQHSNCQTSSISNASSTASTSKRSSRTGLSLRRLSALMRGGSGKSSGETTSQKTSPGSAHHSIQTTRNSSGFSSSSECEELRDLTYATVSSEEVVPMSDRTCGSSASSANRFPFVSQQHSGSSLVKGDARLQEQLKRLTNQTNTNNANGNVEMMSSSPRRLRPYVNVLSRSMDCLATMKPVTRADEDNGNYMYVR